MVNHPSRAYSVATAALSPQPVESRHGRDEYPDARLHDLCGDLFWDGRVDLFPEANGWLCAPGVRLDQSTRRANERSIPIRNQSPQDLFRPRQRLAALARELSGPFQH